MSSILNSRTFVTLLIGVVCFVGGCRDLSPADRAFQSGRGGDFAQLRVADTSLGLVHDEADHAFRTYYRVNVAESEPNAWVSYPAELMEGSDERVSDVLGVSDRRRRKIAYLQIAPAGTGVLVRCRVLIQRLETTDRAAFSRTRNYNGDDRPTDTPIDRSGASSTSRREDWVNSGRDRKDEQAILHAISSALDPPTAPTP